jgi:hypothetical protein
MRVSTTREQQQLFFPTTQRQGSISPCVRQDHKTCTISRTTNTQQIARYLRAGVGEEGAGVGGGHYRSFFVRKMPRPWTMHCWTAGAKWASHFGRSAATQSCQGAAVGYSRTPLGNAKKSRHVAAEEEQRHQIAGWSQITLSEGCPRNSATDPAGGGAGPGSAGILIS